MRASLSTPGKLHVDNMGHGPVHVAVDDDFDLTKLTQEPLLDLSSLVSTMLVFRSGKLGSGPHTHDQGDRLRSGVRPDSCPPPTDMGVSGRRFPLSRRAKQGPDSFRTINLVAADREKIVTQCAKRLDLLAEGLGGIDME